MDSEEITRRELTPADYMAMLRRHWVLIVVLAIIGPPIGYTASRIVPATYQSQTVVLVQPPSVPNTIVPPMDTTSMNQKLASLKQQILSRSSLEPVIREYGLFQQDAKKKSMDDLVAKLQAAVEVTPIAPLADTQSKDLPGFSVTVTLDDPHKAQDVCTQVTSLFIQASNGDTVQRSDQVTQFLTGQLAEAKESLDQQDAKLAAFKSRYMGSLPDDEQSNLNVLSGLNSEYDAASQAIENAQRDKSFAETELQGALAAVHPTADGRTPDKLEQQLDAQKSQLANLQADGYKDTYPDVVATKANIASLEKEIASEASSASDPAKNPKPNANESAQATTLRAQIHAYEETIATKTHAQEELQNQISLYRSRVQQSPMVEENYTELTRGYKTAQDAYDALLKEQHDAEMSGDLNRQQQGEYFHVLDPANLPSKPSFPNRMMFTAGGLAGGLGLGLGLTLFFELKDTSLKSERDVEFSLRLPVLAMIPAVEPATSKKTVMPHVPSEPASASLSLRA
jgi:polysaccharide chain length determinant protein (PEP-CTERM system associated)